MYYPEAKMADLWGKTLDTITGATHGSALITFRFSDGSEYQMVHREDCCERVRVEDISGDWSDIIGHPLLLSDESSNCTDPPVAEEYNDSWTWTFYRFGTRRGYVTIRWYGTSNGYYSERVSLECVQPADGLPPEPEKPAAVAPAGVGHGGYFSLAPGRSVQGAE
ncbi:MAG: hypothetical protein AAB875_01090 [Patescibacteria group bacterium]